MKWNDFLQNLNSPCMTESTVALYLDYPGGGLDGPEAFVRKKFPLTIFFLITGTVNHRPSVVTLNFVPKCPLCLVFFNVTSKTPTYQYKEKERTKVKFQTLFYPRYFLRGKKKADSHNALHRLQSVSRG